MIDVKRGYKMQKQGESRCDRNFEPSKLVYLNTTEIFPADAELDCKHKLVNADLTT